MSEYQYVAFRAIDRPVSEENLEYMHLQSSRAKITPWSFDNEYHFGGFRGDAEEMLRRGYDMHMHYANYGIRTLMIRLPNGLPSAKIADAYIGENELQFKKDKTGKGGTLIVSPYIDGESDSLWDLGGVIDGLVPLRGEILDGDLRPLYIAHLAMTLDANHDPVETREGPVPDGLAELTKAQHALAEFYAVGNAVLAATAKASAPLPQRRANHAAQLAWISGLPTSKKDIWLAQLMFDSQPTVRTAMMEEFRGSGGDPPWPITIANRTIGELLDAATEVSNEAARKVADKAAAERSTRLSSMRDDPMRFIKQAGKLVAERSTSSYRRAAELLAELRDALAGSKRAGLPAKHARLLKDANPTLNVLKKALRDKGFTS